MGSDVAASIAVLLPSGRPGSTINGSAWDAPKWATQLAAVVAHPGLAGDAALCVCGHAAAIMPAVCELAQAAHSPKVWHAAAACILQLMPSTASTVMRLPGGSTSSFTLLETAFGGIDLIVKSGNISSSVRKRMGAEARYVGAWAQKLGT